MSPIKAIENFEEQYHITFPVGKAHGVAKRLMVDSIPETIFLSVHGKIIKRISDKMSSLELVSGIEELLHYTTPG